MADLGDRIDEIAEVLDRGEPIVLPTDTVYGLCALPSRPGAVARLFELKGRADSTPVAVLCADAEQALGLARDPAPVHHAVATACWPGPLTLVLRRRAGLDWPLGEPVDTIGVRCPDHPALSTLAARLGPIAATSANRHGEPPGADVDEIRRQLGPDVVVVGADRLTGVASTVVDATGEVWRLLREGAVSSESLLAAGAPLTHDGA